VAPALAQGFYPGQALMEECGRQVIAERARGGALITTQRRGGAESGEWRNFADYQVKSAICRPGHFGKRYLIPSLPGRGREAPEIRFFE